MKPNFIENLDKINKLEKRKPKLEK